MNRLPENRILKQNNYGDSYGDIVESFNLDLTSNYGAIRTTRMKEVLNTGDSADLALAIGFAFYDTRYWLITDDFAYKGGASPSDTFVKDTSSGAPSNAITESISDIELFNGAMYISQNTTLAKLSGTTWSTPVTTQLTSARPHLLKAYGSGGNERLYVTDEYYKIHSVNTSDAIQATGSFTMDFKLGDDWTITMLEASENALWVGLTNTNDGTGAVYEWDGVTENIWNRKFVLESGVMAGVVLNDVLYIMDGRGKLLRFNGVGFTEEDRLFNQTQYGFNGNSEANNLRFVHPNGMCVTDYGSILIALSNQLAGQIGHTDDVPSGVYEFQPGIGLYHKYSVSTSPRNAVTYTDYGNQRVFQMGAVFYRRPPVPVSGKNGTLLLGAEYFTKTDVTTYGVFIDDSLNTTPKMGYFTTKKFFSDNIEENWNKIYGIYKELESQTDKIVVKYRTREKNSSAVNFIWITDTQFTTTTDISDYGENDEVLITIGNGAGYSLVIKSIQKLGSVYTVTVKENTIGASEPFVGRINNFKSLGTMKKLQYEALTVTRENTSPWIQFKVEMYFTGNQELHKLHVISKSTVKEKYGG